METITNDSLVGHICDLIQTEAVLIRFLVSFDRPQDGEGGWLAVGFLTILFITATVAALIYLWRDLQTNSICSISVPKLFYSFLFGFIIGTSESPPRCSLAGSTDSTVLHMQ